jgi:hypothetical protein
MRYVLGDRRDVGSGALLLGGLAAALYESLAKGSGIGTSPATAASRTIDSAPAVVDLRPSSAAGLPVPPPLPGLPGSVSLPRTSAEAALPGALDAPSAMRAAASLAEGPKPAVVAVPAEVLRVIRLSISAAHADGAFTRAEQEAILAQAAAVGVGAELAADMHQPPRLHDLLADVEDPLQRQHLYTIAFAVVRADEDVTPIERAYLQDLADVLRLDADVVAELERDAAAGIGAGPREIPSAR